MTRHPVVRGLAVLAAVSAAATFGPSYVAQAMARHAAMGASDQVVAALAEGRRLAIGRARPVEVVLDERNRSVVVEGGSWRKLPAGIAMAGPKPDPNGRATLRFNPDGSTDSAQVVVSGRGRAVALLLDQGGGVRRIEAGNGRAR